MFSKIVLDNFKCFSHFELDLLQNKESKKVKNLAFIYGENSIGKSTIVDAFLLLSKLVSSIEQKAFFERFFSALNTEDKFPFNRYFLSPDVSYDAPTYLKYLKKIDSTEPMSVQYEGYINFKKFVYRVEFDNDKIINEKCLINGLFVFGTGRYGFAKLSSSYFSSQELIDKINERSRMYNGKYSILSCIHSVLNDADKKFVLANVNKQVIDFVNEMDSLTVYRAANINSAMLSKNPKLLQMLTFGIFNDNLKAQLELTKTALTMYFSLVSPNIRGVDYDFEIKNGNQRYYHLIFLEKNGDSTIRVPYYYASTGVKKLLDLFPIFFEIAYSNHVVVIDEVDSGINDILLESIFSSFCKEVKGQLIVTTHNTLLLKKINKKYVYLLDKDENDEVYSYSLDSFGRKIQPKTNVVKQYLEGLYGGVPQTGNFSMKYIINEVKNG